MKLDSPDNNPYRVSSPSSESVAESNHSPPRSFGRGFRRAVVLSLVSTIGGLLIGMLSWWLVTSAWSLFEGWWWPSSGRGSGGDPIGNWAEGVTRMFVMLTFVVPSTAIGFGIGIRLAASGATTRQGYLKELRRCVRAAHRFVSTPRNRPANVSLAASVGALYVLNAGFSASRNMPVSAALPTALVLIVFSLYAAVRGMRQKPRSMAVFTLCVAGYNLWLLGAAVWKEGFERFLEEWM